MSRTDRSEGRLGGVEGRGESGERTPTRPHAGLRSPGVAPGAFLLGAAALLAAPAVGLPSAAAAQEAGWEPGERGWTPVTQAFLNDPPPGAWPSRRRTLDHQAFTPLAQITPANVGELAVAWIFDTGVTGSVQWEPIVVNGRMFLQLNCAGVVALDAATGALLWRYTYELLPPAERQARGVSGCQASRGLTVFDDRIMAHFGDSHIVALDALSGEELWKTFTDGLGYSSPGIMAGGVLVSGNRAKDHDRAFVTGIDPYSGEILWKRYVIPGPGEYGYDSWEVEGTAEIGHGSVWLTPSHDPELDLVYIPTGNPDPYTSWTRPGDNLYTNSVLALRPATGEIVWYHQYIPHDSWDQDMAMSPVLADLEIEGELRKVLVHSGKSGFTNVLDRATGEFLGHRFTTYQNIFLDVDPVTGRPVMNDALRPRPGVQVTACPSTRGGTDWPGRAFSPETGLYYISGNHVCMEVEGIEFVPGETPLRNIADRMVPAPGHDHIGELWAIDPVTLETAWSIRYPIATSATPLPTGSGLLFVGHMDRNLYAYDAATGEELWRRGLDHHIESHPISYEVDGVQYLAVATGGGSLIGGALVRLLSPDWNLPRQSGMLWVFRLRE